MADPARELAQRIDGLVKRIEANLPLMKSSASFDSKDATIENQLYSYFSHFDEDKLKAILILLRL
jgi:hypothetical protein